MKSLEKWIKDEGYEIKDKGDLISLVTPDKTIWWSGERTETSVEIEKLSPGVVIIFDAYYVGRVELAATLEYSKKIAKKMEGKILLYSVAAKQKQVINVLKSLNFKEGVWVKNPRHNSRICLFSFNLSQV